MAFRAIGFCRPFVGRVCIAIALAAAVGVCPELLIQTARSQTTAPRPADDASKSAKQTTAPGGQTTTGTAAAARTKKTQAELEAELAKQLSGATLEGSFNTTGPGRDGARLSADKYTLGEVRKLDGNIWMIQAKMRDAMIPLPLPIEWAGDTPVIIVDNFTIPGMGTFSARVMFFADHYAGYWKHDERGGSMFGVIHRAGANATSPAAAAPATTPTMPPVSDGKQKQ
jgi:hypothetical protein